MNRPLAVVAPAAPSRLPCFGGFPYLVTRVVPTLYHVNLLPEGLSPAELESVVRCQAEANRLPTSLVLGPDRALYVSPDGEASWSDSVPRGGVLVSGRLRPCRAFAATRHLVARRALLDQWIAAQGAKGFMLGDLAKGGRKPTFQESVWLAGRQPDGVPRGLSGCPFCSEWRGQCLDPEAGATALVVTVHCRCENDNRCAECGQRLRGRRLNANYYSPADGRVWHAPGFSAFSHMCNLVGE